MAARSEAAAQSGVRRLRQGPAGPPSRTARTGPGSRARTGRRAGPPRRFPRPRRHAPPAPGRRAHDPRATPRGRGPRRVPVRGPTGSASEGSCYSRAGAGIVSRLSAVSAIARRRSHPAAVPLQHSVQDDLHRLAGRQDAQDRRETREVRDLPAVHTQSTSPSRTPAFSAGEPAVTPATFTPGPLKAKSGRVPKLTRRPCADAPGATAGAAAGLRWASGGDGGRSRRSCRQRDRHRLLPLGEVGDRLPGERRHLRHAGEVELVDRVGGTVVVGVRARRRPGRPARPFSMKVAWSEPSNPSLGYCALDAGHEAGASEDVRPLRRADVVPSTDSFRSPRRPTVSRLITPIVLSRGTAADLAT